MRTVAITGTNGFIGGMVLGALLKHKTIRVIAIDRAAPVIRARNLQFVACDLTSDHADQELTKLFHRTKCDTVVHAALHSQPKRDAEYTHELQSIGTMYLLHAIAASAVRKLIVSSTTDVYGAYPDNPNFLSEAHPLRGRRLGAFLRDKVDVEQQVARFAAAQPQRVVTVLRPCTILGPQIRNYKTHLLKHPIIATVLGFDPLVQFVHEADVARAFVIAILQDHPGAYNIVGADVVPLSRALAFMRKTQLPIPGTLLELTLTALWHLELEQTPPSHIHFLKYPCVADGRKAAQDFGFRSEHTLEETLQGYRGVAHA